MRLGPALMLSVALSMTGCRRHPPRRAVAIPTDTAPGAAPAQPVPTLAMRDVDPRFDTAAHMLASLEMQISGEPLAETMGRTLTGYDRNALPTDRYTDPLTQQSTSDLAGYSAAVESYEYSRQPMNTVAFETGAGTSLAFGPLINPVTAAGQRSGRAAHDRLRDFVQRAAIASHAGVRAGPPRDARAADIRFVAVPAPSDNEMNTLGFGGLWPTMHPYRAFEPTIRPSNNATRGCTLEGGYGATAGTAVAVGDYECGYRSLHLVARRDQIEAFVTPGATGFSAWKYALWLINYMQLFHDSDGRPVARVEPSDNAAVGREANVIRGRRADGSEAAAGTWLGSNDLEGFQAAVLAQGIDDEAQHILTTLTTVDGSTLSGFTSIADALAHDHASPLRWMPAVIAVTETADLAATFPQPATYTLRDAHPPLLHALGMLGGFAEMFALADHANPDVGGAATARAYFDGEPFADDDQLPDGDATPHDRWLAMVKFAFVSLDRLYADANGRLSGTTSVTAGVAQRGNEISTYDIAYAIVSLRAARRALAGQLTLYGDSTPDSAITRTALDATSWRNAPGGQRPGDRLTALILAQSRLLLDQLTDLDGRASGGWNLRLDSASTEGDLEAHAAAVRGLLEAYLATGDVRYRERARRVFDRIERDFYDSVTQMYWFTRRAGAADATTWTPRRFGIVQSALREMYKLIGSKPGNDALGTLVALRFARLNKLVLNGWNDRDGDAVVDYPEECLRVENGFGRGGLQMAERALSGESGVERGAPTVDRDRDCVPEIDDAMVPAVLAASVRIVVR